MAATATLEGNSHWAMIGANKVSEHVHPEIMKQPGWGTLQHYYSIPYYVAVKFKKWDDILAMDLKTYDLKYPMAVRHYAEGMAYLGLNNLDKAKAELSELQVLAKDESIKDITIFDINTVYDLVLIAEKVLQSEILAHENNYDESISLLKEAVEIEDALNYTEPPDWFFSIRHHLGAIQIKSGLYIEAITTYEEDLKRLPRNGWAYHGLKAAYTKLGNEEKAKYMQVYINESWVDADFEIVL